MSEAEKPKRRFWQLHLSTAVLLMLVTGGLMFANFQFGPELYAKLHDIPAPARNPLPSPKIFYRVRGWPFMSSSIVEATPSQTNSYCWLDGEAFMAGAVFNVPICILIICTFAFVCEYLIRRREGGRP